MNVISFLKPINEVIYVYDDHTVMEALEIMEKHRYTTIPIINRVGNYVGTLSEGDLLWDFKNETNFQFTKSKERLVSNIKRLRDYEAININATIITLITKAADENFVPIIDDNEVFMGIVTRKTLLNYFFEHNFVVL